MKREGEGEYVGEKRDMGRGERRKEIGVGKMGVGERGGIGGEKTKGEEKMKEGGKEEEERKRRKR